MESYKIMTWKETLKFDKKKKLFGQEVARLTKLSRSQRRVFKPEFMFKTKPKSKPNPPIAL